MCCRRSRGVGGDDLAVGRRRQRERDEPGAVGDLRPRCRCCPDPWSRRMIGHEQLHRAVGARVRVDTRVRLVGQHRGEHRFIDVGVGVGGSVHGAEGREVDPGRVAGAVVVDRVLGDRVGLRDRGRGVDWLHTVRFELHADRVVGDLVTGAEGDVRGAGLMSRQPAGVRARRAPSAVTPILLFAITESCTPLSTSTRVAAGVHDDVVGHGCVAHVGQACLVVAPTARPRGARRRARCPHVRRHVYRWVRCRCSCRSPSCRAWWGSAKSRCPRDCCPTRDCAAACRCLRPTCSRCRY